LVLYSILFHNETQIEHFLSTFHNWVTVYKDGTRHKTRILLQPKTLSSNTSIHLKNYARQ